MADVIGREDMLAVTKPVARLSWGGIFAGAICTIAIGIVLLSLGAAIGLTAVNPARGEWGGSAGPIAGGVWALISIVLATFLGSWISSRHATLFDKRDAMAQGLSSWAVAFLFGTWLIASSAIGAVATAGRVAGSALDTAGQAAQGAGQSGAVNQQDLERMQRQVQQNLPGGAQVQQNATQVAEGAANAGAAASWAYFVTAFLGMLAGIFGGLTGLPKAFKQKQHLEVRRTAETRA